MDFVVRLEFVSVSTIYKVELMDLDFSAKRSALYPFGSCLTIRAGMERDIPIKK